HRAVRVDETRHVDGAIGSTNKSGRSFRAAGGAFPPDFRDHGPRRLWGRGGEDMTDVVMPQMGESIVEGTLTKWLKKPGEHVERDEPLFEISTDKVDTEIPAPAAGTLSEVLVEEGKTVGINTVVARIAEGGEAAAQPAQPKPQAPKAEAAKPAEPAPAPAPPA